MDGLPPNVRPIFSVPATQILLLNILASDSLDEISDIDDGDSIRRYLTFKGKAHNGVLRTGVLFWLYPTGCVGPIETLEEDCERGKKGNVLHHGVLVTVVSGVNVEAAVGVIKAALPVNGLTTLHVPTN